MARDGNTYAKKARETLKRQKAEAKRDRRRKAKTCRNRATPPRPIPRQARCDRFYGGNVESFVWASRGAVFLTSSLQRSSKWPL